jgi:cytochrome c oxidase subunit 2
VSVRALLSLAALSFLTACSTFGVPEGATEQGQAIADLWRVFTIAGLAVGGIVTGLILWSVIRYRRRDRGRPAEFRDNLPMEILYTAIPVLIVTSLFALTFRVESGIERPSPRPETVIGVTAFDWSWRFDYGDGAVITGTPDDPPQMVVPAGRPVRIVLSSTDVIHSFYVPDFLFKRDATPGLVQRFDFLVEEEGIYGGQCAEFCGLDHARMRFTVRAVPAAEFAAWLEEAREAGA